MQDTYDLLVPKTGTIDDLVEVLIRKAQIPSEMDGGRIRIYETSSNRFYREPLREHPVINLNEFAKIYAERVPQEELNADDTHFIHVFHFHNDVSRVHGVPFKFLVIEVSALDTETHQCINMVVGRELCRYQEAIGEANRNQRQEF